MINGQFDPLPRPKHARGFRRVDDKLIAPVRAGREHAGQAHIAEIHGITVSPSLVSVVAEVMPSKSQPAEQFDVPLMLETACSNRLTHRIQASPVQELSDAIAAEYPHT